MEVPIELRSFKGLNLRESSAVIADDELSQCINFNIGRAGELTKRPGFSVLHTGTTLGFYRVNIIGHLFNSTYSQIIVQAGSNTYFTEDGVNYNLLGAYNIEYGVQYVDRFYMVRQDGDMIIWDGTTASVVTDSPAGTFVSVFKDRLYVINSLAAGDVDSHLFFSDIIIDPDVIVFPSENLLTVLPGNGDFLTCTAVLHDNLVIFKGSSTHLLYVEGLPENWSVDILDPVIGCSSKYTAKEIEGEVFFIGSKGVYSTDGSNVSSRSGALQSLFNNRIVNKVTVNTDSAAWWDDKYIVFIQFSSEVRRYFVLHLTTGSWTEWVPAEGITPNTFVEVHSGLPTKGLYCGDFSQTGKIFRFGDGGYTDSGSIYEASFVTKDYDFGVPTFKKRGKWTGIDIAGQGMVDFNHRVDREIRGPFVIEAPNEERTELKFPGPGYFRTWALEMSINSSDPFEIYGITLVTHAKSKVRRGAT